MRRGQSRRLPAAWWLAALLLLSATHAATHSSGCHRWHSCPSDRGTYVCGDTGHCSQCPDNAYCLRSQPRTAKSAAPAPVAPQLAPARQAPFMGKVVAIADGDTVSVLRDGKAVKVRLHGIDTPEKAQPFGARARQRTGELAFKGLSEFKLFHIESRYL